MATKLTLAQRAKKDPKLLARVLKNPGLRSKLPTSMLPKEMQQRRQLNARLAAPITEGSSTTERDLAREADAAANVKYGDVQAAEQRGFQQEQQRQRDFRGFYDQYLAQLGAHSAAVNTIGQQAAATGLAAQQGITGLAGADMTALQGQANAGAAQRGVAPAGDITGMASNAAGIRQALTGSFIANQAAQNAANSTFASNRAQVVGPTQKLAGEAISQGRVREAGEKIRATAKEKGAFNESFRAERRSDEAKQVLAKQTLGANIADKKADNAAAAAEKASKLNKYGYTTSEWSKLSEKQRAKARAGKSKKATGGDPNRVYTSGPFAGKSKAYIDGLTQAERDKIVSTYNNRTKPKTADQKYAEDFKKKYGVAPAKPEQVTKAKSQISQAKVWLERLKDMGPDEAGKLLTTGGTVPVEGQKGGMKVPSLDPVLIRAAMDMRKLKGYISASTADRLHRAGYSVPGLGLKTPSHSTGPNAPVGKPPQKTGY